MQKTNEGNRKNESNRRNDNVNLKELYKVGQRVEGKIVLFFKAGKEHPDQSALVELNQGGTALLLYSEILGYPTNKLQSLYTLGESVEASVIAILVCVVATAVIGTWTVRQRRWRSYRRQPLMA